MGFYFKPKPLGEKQLNNDTLREDKQACARFGPCGVGKKALYLNSFYIDRKYYIPAGSVTRVYKRIAMSKGGFTGRGIFSTMPYLVVEYDNGRVKQCNFKYEQSVDRMIDFIKKNFSNIKTLSAQGELTLERERLRDESRKKKDLSETAQTSLHRLENALAFLEKRPELSKELSLASKAKREHEISHPAYFWFSVIIMVIGVLMACLGGAYMIQNKGSFGIYFLFGGLTMIFIFAGIMAAPTAHRNKRDVTARLEKARNDMADYLRWYGSHFPLPAKYAHPAALQRMIRSIEEGRSETVEEAFTCLKADLQKLNSSVQVSKQEYDEVVAIKPMFLLENYE